MEFLAGVGLTQGYLVGVEGCAVELGLGASVEGIAQERAGLGGHVEANLVGSAGFQVEGEAIVLLCRSRGVYRGFWRVCREGWRSCEGGFPDRGTLGCQSGSRHLCLMWFQDFPGAG